MGDNYFGNANEHKTLLKTFVFHFESKVETKLVKIFKLVN